MSFPTLYQSCAMFSVSVLSWRCLRHFSIGFSANEKKYKTLSKNMTKRFFIIISPLQIYTFIMITQKMCCYCVNTYFCGRGRIRTATFRIKVWCATITLHVYDNIVYSTALTVVFVTMSYRPIALRVWYVSRCPSIHSWTSSTLYNATGLPFPLRENRVPTKPHIRNWCSQSCDISNIRLTASMDLKFSCSISFVFVVIQKYPTFAGAGASTAITITADSDFVFLNRETSSKLPVDAGGFEPPIVRLWAGCSDLLSYASIKAARTYHSPTHPAQGLDSCGHPPRASQRTTGWLI